MPAKVKDKKNKGNGFYSWTLMSLMVISVICSFFVTALITRISDQSLTATVEFEIAANLFIALIVYFTTLSIFYLVIFLLRQVNKNAALNRLASSINVGIAHLHVDYTPPEGPKGLWKIVSKREQERENEKFRLEFFNMPEKNQIDTVYEIFMEVNSSHKKALCFILFFLIPILKMGYCFFITYGNDVSVGDLTLLSKNNATLYYLIVDCFLILFVHWFVVRRHGATLSVEQFAVIWTERCQGSSRQSLGGMLGGGWS